MHCAIRQNPAVNYSAFEPIVAIQSLILGGQIGVALVDEHAEAKPKRLAGMDR